MKHGGRVEVPHHPHNVRRFMSGKMHAYYDRQDRFLDGMAAWERMSIQGRRDLLNALPPLAVTDKRALYAAALLLEIGEAGLITVTEFQRRWQELIR